MDTGDIHGPLKSIDFTRYDPFRGVIEADAAGCIGRNSNGPLPVVWRPMRYGRNINNPRRIATLERDNNDARPILQAMVLATPVLLVPEIGIFDDHARSRAGNTQRTLHVLDWWNLLIVYFMIELLGKCGRFGVPNGLHPLFVQLPNLEYLRRL